MADPSSQRVSCPSCNKGYRWQASIIGRTVPCKQCGEKFIVPESPGVGQPLAQEDGTYELDFEEESTQSDNESVHKAVEARDGKCPSCNASLREGAVLCMNCGFSLAEGRKLDTQRVVNESETGEADAVKKDDEPVSREETRDARDAAQAADTLRRHRFDEIILPSILLGTGLIMMLINGLLLTPMENDALQLYTTNGEAIAAYFIICGITLVFMIPLLFGGMFLMVAMLGSAFGNLFTAIYKLFAMTFLIVGVDNLVNLLLNVMTGGFACMGWTIRLAVLAAVFWPISKKLFDMESYETLILFLLYLGGPILIGFAAIVILSYF